MPIRLFGAMLLLLCAVSARPGHAAGPLLPLGDLVRRADLVVIARVSEVETDAKGAQLATLEVEQAFSAAKAGPADTIRPGVASHITVAGHADDSSAARFETGVRVLALLKSPGHSEKTEARKPHRVVGGDHGLMALTDDLVEPTRSWLAVMFSARNEIDLPLMEPLLRRTEPLPHPVLFASCVEELDRRVAAKGGKKDRHRRRDTELLDGMACAPAGTYWADARRWALRAAGRERSAGAGPCLEEVAKSDDADVDTRAAAIMGMGDLGDPARAPALVTLIESAEDSSAEEERAEAPLLEPAALALGKIGDPSAIDALRDVALGAEFAGASTAVHAIGLIGGRDAIRALREVASQSANADLRAQARDTISQLR